MPIQAAMSVDGSKDNHEHDLVMPGFRFHPTEEELIEFYLRRKVEGKRFNVQLISFIDLYRYDPWELPALAAIGGKEWFFYAPRDRKYRNGDRPNRVTTSGYWKATGADRTIMTDNSRSIGLKKTLVFYAGKAPKGIRTSWTMNEYRLPQIDTRVFQKAFHHKTEISLCKVYRRAGIDDRHHHFPPRRTFSKPSTSAPSKSKHNVNTLKPTFTPIQEHPPSPKTKKIIIQDHHDHIPPSDHNNNNDAAIFGMPSLMSPTTTTTTRTEEEEYSTLLLHHMIKNNNACLVPNSSPSSIDKLTRLEDYQDNSSIMQQQQQGSNHYIPLPLQYSQLPHFNTSIPNPMLITNITDKLWEWSNLSVVDDAGGRDHASF